jgi:hypothetical protein
LLNITNAFTQDLYNFDNTKKFAQYLAKSGQFDIATREYERLVFMRPDNDTLKTTLLSLYRRSGKLEDGLSRGKQLFPDLTKMPANAALEYSRTLLLKPAYKEAQSFAENNSLLPHGDKLILSATSEILRDNYKQANQILKALKDDEHHLAIDYKELTQQALEAKHKSPALAGFMSAVIPGTGRFYTKDWKDGLISMLFIGTMGFQAYRGFLKSGTNSTRGWIYGTVGLGFYLGNIYGSAQSAKFYNKKKRQNIKNSLDKLFNSYY